MQQQSQLYEEARPSPDWTSLWIMAMYECEILYNFCLLNNTEVFVFWNVLKICGWVRCFLKLVKIVIRMH